MHLLYAGLWKGQRGVEGREAEDTSNRKLKDIRVTVAEKFARGQGRLHLSWWVGSSSSGSGGPRGAKSQGKGQGLERRRAGCIFKVRGGPRTDKWEEAGGS